MFENAIKEDEEDERPHEYDPIHDPNLEDLDPAEIQEYRAAAHNQDGYW